MQNTLLKILTLLNDNNKKTEYEAILQAYFLIYKKKV